VVIMTALYTQGKYKTEALRQYLADEYLAKPLQFSVLRQTLQKFLG
jgi:response regulator of citrate/malate metabolism